MFLIKQVWLICSFIFAYHVQETGQEKKEYDEAELFHPFKLSFSND